MNEEERQIVPLGTLYVDGSLAVIQRASEIATALARLVTDRKLFIVIGRERYVLYEGWATLGAMLGLLPREVCARRLDDGGYEAVVELVRVSDNAVVSRASALCGMDEVDRAGRPTWAERPEYARRSMAITRAAGKAFRLALSWVMVLAGYAPTPAEEIVDAPEIADAHPAPRPASPDKPKPRTDRPDRPYDPATLKRGLEQAIAKKSAAQHAAPATSGQCGLAASKLEECFAPAEDAKERRRAVMLWLLGKESVTELTMAEASALLDWLIDKSSANAGAYDLHPAAPAEASAALRQALVEAGQLELSFSSAEASAEEERVNSEEVNDE